MKRFGIFFGGFFFVVWGMMALEDMDVGIGQSIDVDDNVTIVKKEPKPRALTREEKIDREFNYDGSFIPLVTEVIKTMHHPDSFKHIETKVMDRESNLFITMRYQGRSLAGNMVTHQVSAIYYPDKNQYEII